MGWFRKDKKKSDAVVSAADRRQATGKKRASRDDRPIEESTSGDERVGVVSSVLTPSQDGRVETPFGDVVARRFGPANGRSDADESVVATVVVKGPGTPPKPARKNAMTEDTHSTEQHTAPRLRAVDPPPHSLSTHPLSTHPMSTTGTTTESIPELEIDPMAHIGSATTITGNIVAEEDLEIRGTVEGSVRLANHMVTVGGEGHVKASVDAESVHVHGRITGDVVASDLVEVMPGGIIGGDVKAPRIIMHDGAIVVGGLDMSAALPCAAEGTAPSTSSVSSDSAQDRELPPVARPHLKKVESPVEGEAREEDGS